jgi:hypothetical protein
MKPKPIEVPKLRDHSATLADLESRKARLGAEWSQKVAEHLAAARDTTPEATPTDPAIARVAELMGEPPPRIVPERREILARLVRECFELKSALELLDKRIMVERTKAAAIVRELVAPEYASRMRLVCEALMAAHAANESISDLVDAMEVEGISTSGMLPMRPLAVLGSPRDPQSQLANFLRDAVAAGVIRQKEMPIGLVHR